MAARTDLPAPSPSSGGSDLEEGELVAGYDDPAGSDLPDDDTRHVGILVDGGALPSFSPSCESIADAGAASLAKEMLFTREKAVSGHMSVHGPNGRLQGNKERPPVTPPISGGCAGRSVSQEKDGVVNAMATVVSEPVPDPMPSSSSNVEPNKDPMVLLPSGCLPQFLQGHLPDDDTRHVGDGVIKPPRLEFEGILVDGAALPSLSPSCESIVDADADAGAASPAQELLLTGEKAVSGHMGVHGPHGRLQQWGNKERPPVTPPISGGCAGRSVSQEKDGVVNAMATVVSEPVPDPMPSSSSNVEPNKNPMVLLPSGCLPQFLQGHQPATSHVIVARGQQLAEETARQFVSHQAAASQVVTGKRSSVGGGSLSQGSGGVVDCPPNKDPVSTPAKFTSGAQFGGHIKRPMDQLKDGLHLRLRSRVHGTYLHADGDGCGVSLRSCKGSMNTGWVVHRDGDSRYVRLYSAAYGYYLTATDASAPLGCHGFRIELGSFNNRQEQALFWQALGTRSGNDVILVRNVGKRGRYLRGNGRFFRWNINNVSLDDISKLNTMMEWVVEPIPSTRDFVLRHSHIHANGKYLAWNDKTVVYDTMLWVAQPIRPPMPALSFLVRPRTAIFQGNDQWAGFSFTFGGRSVYRLRKELVSRLGISTETSMYLVMYIRGGRYGRFTPLVVNLPRRSQTIVVTAEMRVNAWLLYPTMREEGDVDYKWRLGRGRRC